MTTLIYPVRQSIALSNTLFKQYYKAKLSKDNKILFDLTKSESLTPFGIILLTATIVECQSQGKECSLKRPKNRKLQRFLRDIGFNNFFGLKGISLQRNLIETSYLQLRKAEGLDYYIIGILIDLFDHHLNLSSGVKGSLQMSLQETMTNVIDHSGVREYYVCAYAYPEKRQIRLCIADLGVGILQSLKISPDHANLSNDYDAIKLATVDGVSSRNERDGMGLNHIKNFIKINKGQMCIISGRGKVYWKFDQGKILEQNMDTPFHGTIVKLIINIDKEGFYFLSDEKEYLF